MYAAAGGLSLASKRARNIKNKQNHSADAHHGRRHQSHNQNALTFARPHTPLPPIPVQQPAEKTQHHHHHHHQQQQQQPPPQQPQQQQQEQRLHSEERENNETPGSFAELNGRITSFGSNDLISEGQGSKAAWQDRERQVSIAEVAVNHRIKATEAHRRWMKRNRIHDSSFGGSSSDEDDIPGGLYGHQSAAANALLYVGLGTVAIGLVIAFVGTGEKGFKTLELRLIGPSLIGGGLLCCLVRVALCVCPFRCLRRRRKSKHRHKESSLRHDHGYNNGNSKDLVEEIQLTDQTNLVRKNSKKAVSILASPLAVPSSSSQDQYPIIASTTMFLQNEKERSSKPVNSSAGTYKHHQQIPTINIPNFISSNSDEEGSIGSLQAMKKNSPTGTYDLLQFELQQLDKIESSLVDRSNRKSDPFGEEISELGTNLPGLSARGGVRDFLDRESGPKRSAKLTKDYDSSDSDNVKIINRDSKITKPRAPVNTRSLSASSSKNKVGLINPDPDAHRLENDIVNKALKKFSSNSSTPKHRDLDALLRNEIVLSPSKLQQRIREQ